MTKHQKCVIRRVIKFIFEKGGFIRYAVSNKSRNSLFRSYKNNKEELFDVMVKYFEKILFDISTHNIRDQLTYDKFFKRKVKHFYKTLLRNKMVHGCKGKEFIYWSYLTKTFNILIYNLISQIELMDKNNYHKFQKFIHVPIDIAVMDELKKRIQKLKLPKIKRNELLGNIDKAYFKSDFKKNRLMAINSKYKYYLIQQTIRIVQGLRNEPNIYIEDVYSHK